MSARVSKFAQAGVGALLTASSLGLASCSSRPEIWTTAILPGAPVAGVQNAVVAIDSPADRAILLFPKEDQKIAAAMVPIGHNVQALNVSPDQKRVFILTAGDVPRRHETDQAPQLLAIDPDETAPVVRSYPLSAPLSGLAMDPLGEWVVAYAAGLKGGSFVENPNELILFNLKEQDTQSAVTSITIPSFGGRPQRLTFTQKLNLPGGPRRLLIVETEQDIALLDLDHVTPSAHRDPITIRLTSGDSARSVTPGGVVVDDGDPAIKDDARIAVRLVNDSNVFTITLGPVPADRAGTVPNDFSPTINLTDVGGVASDLAFVHTNGAAMLAALVPSQTAAVLFDPETSVTTKVALPQPYQRMSLVTSIVSGGPSSANDTALLWSANGVGTGNGVAFWSLGKTEGEPYRSVEVLTLGASISDVMSVAPPHEELKVLQAGGQGRFYVLDLVKRQASLLETDRSALLQLSPGGERLWAYKGGSLASVDLKSGHPTPVTLDRNIDAIFDVERDGGNSLLVLHRGGDLGFTVFDANSLDVATARFHSGLVLQGLQ